MNRLRSTLVLAAAIAAVAAPSAGAYGHLGEQAGSQVLTQHWRTSSLPIALTVDNGPTDVLAEIDTARGTWNAVATARDVWGAATPALDGNGAPLDFNADNYGTAWGNLDGDGRQEVVFDEDGKALLALGYAPASVNGFGLSAGVINGGEAEINDMFLLINGSRSNFDRQATEVHELGHTLGLAHSTVGFPVGKDSALSSVLEAAVPTMHPFSISTNDRQSLEDDDRAALSELYPEPGGTFTSTLGTITGTVTRCGSGEPVLGANVRAINVGDPSIQLSRVTGFDGRTDGSYTIRGVPPGDYDVVTISGALTHFAGGASVAGFGAGVTVNRLTVSSPTSAVANVTVDPGAAAGFRDVAVQTGGENAAESVPGPFLVTAATPAIPRLMAASPSSGVRGATVDVAITGADTTFAGGTSTASVSGSGVQVLSTTVSSPTAAVARLRIAAGAPLGFRDLKVATGAQEAALLDGFEIRPAKSAGGGGGPPSTCTDRTRPSASFLEGKQGVRAKKRVLRLRGRASDAGCVAAISVAGKVARVEAAISRRTGRKCRFVTSSGRLTRARRCSNPVWLEAKGTTSWSLSTRRRLRPGKYTIRVRALDAAGNRQATPARRTQRVS